MLQTSYQITAQINEKSFNLAVREPSKTEKEELDKKAQIGKDKLKVLELLAFRAKEAEVELKSIKNTLEINQNLMDDKNVDKQAILAENKTLNSRIYELEKSSIELEKLSREGAGLENQFEELMRFKSELLISGEDKDKCLAYIDEVGITHTAFWEELKGLVLKASQKK